MIRKFAIAGGAGTLAPTLAVPSHCYAVLQQDSFSVRTLVHASRGVCLRNGKEVLRFRRGKIPRSSSASAETRRSMAAPSRNDSHCHKKPNRLLENVDLSYTCQPKRLLLRFVANCDEASWHFLLWDSVKSVVGVWQTGRRVSQMGCYNACPRGTMTNLTGVIRKLQKEKQRVQGEMERLNAALAALGSLGSLEGKSKPSRAPKARRTMSVAARKRIAAAQRARWAKWKKSERNK